LTSNGLKRLSIMVHGKNDAYSGTCGRPFRSHPATCSDAFGHL
jgi:hypothetical protein